MPAFLPLWEIRFTLFWVCASTCIHDTMHWTCCSRDYSRVEIHMQYLNVVFYFNTQTHTQNNNRLLTLLSSTALSDLKFPFLLIFSKDTRIDLGHIGQLDVLSGADPAKQRKHNLSFCFYWGVANSVHTTITAVWKKWLCWRNRW